MNPIERRNEETRPGIRGITRNKKAITHVTLRFWRRRVASDYISGNTGPCIRSVVKKRRENWSGIPEGFVYRVW